MKRAMSPAWVRVADPALEQAVTRCLQQGGITVRRDPCVGVPAPLVVVQEAPADSDGLGLLTAQLGAFWSSPPALILVQVKPVAYSPGEALAAGADDVLAWPSAADELAPRVGALLRRRLADMDRHPLTGLPGSAALQRDLAAVLEKRAPVAVLGCDLRHFKAFNDCYGFLRGDEVLLFLSQVLQQVAGTAGIVYHIGGDDFVITTSPVRADEMARMAVERFNQGVREFYDDEDRRRGFIHTLGRETGAPVECGLMDLTVACATNNEAGDMDHPGRFSAVLAELKGYARQQGQGYVRDRRRTHDVAQALRQRSEPRGGQMDADAESPRTP